MHYFPCSILELPNKTTLFATLVALVNRSHHKFGARILATIRTLFLSAMHSMDMIRIKILLRFFNELMNAYVITADDVMTVYEFIIDEVQPQIPLVYRQRF